MSIDTRKVFPVQRKSTPSDDLTTHPGKLFRDLWDIHSIGEAVKIAEENQEIPRFSLDKVEIHPAGYCNLNCNFCYGQKLVPEPCKRMNLPNGVISSVLRDIRENMPEEDPHIVFAGMYSEPLLHPEILGATDELGRLGYRFGLYTNGLVMKEDIMQSLANSAKRARSSRPGYVSFNVTASLVSDNFYKGLLPVIEKLAEIKQRESSPLQINASILAITGRSTFDSFYSVIRDLDNAGIDNARLSFPWAPQEGGEVEMYGFLPKQDYRRAVEVFQELEEKFQNVTIRSPDMKPFDHCFAMSQALAISPEGEVYPCPEVCAPIFRERYSYGSVLSQRISEVWRGKKHLEVFARLDPRGSRCTCCTVDEEFNKLCATYWQPGFRRV